MRVRLLDTNDNGKPVIIEDFDEKDVAYLFHQTRLTCAAIQSEAIFTMFEAYMKRHSLDYDPEPIDEWDENFIQQFTSIETLNHLIMLARRTSQGVLLELCQQRLAQLQASDSDSDNNSDGDDGSNSGGDDNDHNNDDDNSVHGDDSDNDDGGNSDEDNSDGDDGDHNDDDDSNSGGDDTDGDEVDDMGNQMQDLSDQELFVCGSHAGNLSLEVSSGSSKDTNDLTPEVSTDRCGGKIDNMDSKEHLSLELANTAGCEAVMAKRISDEGVGEGGAAHRGPSRSSKKPQDFAAELHCAGVRVRAIKPSAFTGQPVRDATGCASHLFGSLFSLGHEERAQKIPDMPSRRPHKQCCKVCNKKFLSGKALGGHMSHHRHAGKQPKSTPSPPAIVIDLPVLLLGPSDEKPSPSSLESQCLHCSKVFSSCESPRGDMGMHSENLMAKCDEEPEPAGLMKAWANANSDHRPNAMLFSPVKLKRSKRGMPDLNSEMNSAAAVLMLAEHSDKTSAYEACCGGDKDDNISTPMVLKEVNLNASEQLDQSYEFTNSARLKTDMNPAYEGFYESCEKENSLNLASDARKEVLLNVFDYEMDVEGEFKKPGAGISVEELSSGDLSPGNLLRSGYALGCHMRLHCEKGNSLNLVADAPKKEVLLNVFEHGMDLDAEFMKAGADISVEECKSSDFSATMNSKRHQCKVCGKLLRSGLALGDHMTLHLNFEKKDRSSLVADVRKEVLLNAFDNEVNADVEWMMPGAAFSVELESSDSSAVVNVKKHQCKVCGKLLGSGHALGGHMRLHYVWKCNLHQDVADCPDSVMMEEQMQKLELDSPIFIDRDHIHMVEDLMLRHSVC